MRVDDEEKKLADFAKFKLNKQIQHFIEVIVDRLEIKKGAESRLSEAVETALQEGDGLVLVSIEKKERLYSQHNACIDCGLSFEDLQPRIFSFNSPFGACPAFHCLFLFPKIPGQLWARPRKF